MAVINFALHLNLFLPLVVALAPCVRSVCAFVCECDQSEKREDEKNAVIRPREANATVPPRRYLRHDLPWLRSREQLRGGYCAPNLWSFVWMRWEGKSASRKKTIKKPKKRWKSISSGNRRANKKMTTTTRSVSIVIGGRLAIVCAFAGKLKLCSALGLVPQILLAIAHERTVEWLRKDDKYSCASYRRLLLLQLIWMWCDDALAKLAHINIARTPLTHTYTPKLKMNWREMLAFANNRRSVRTCIHEVNESVKDKKRKSLRERWAAGCMQKAHQKHNALIKYHFGGALAASVLAADVIIISVKIYSVLSFTRKDHWID